jgi:hypothetical protein
MGMGVFALPIMSDHDFMEYSNFDDFLYGNN